MGRTLTASPGTITDADGLTNASYSYQWILVDGADEEDISDKTAATLRLTAAYVGKIFKVRASFTDDAGTAESRTSAPTAPVAYSAPSTLGVVVGVGQVVLWWEHAVLGGLSLSHYEYRYSSGDMISPTAMWQQVQAIGGIVASQAYYQVVTGLTSGTTPYLPGSCGNRWCQGRAGDRDRDTSITAVLHHRRVRRPAPALAGPTDSRDTRHFFRWRDRDRVWAWSGNAWNPDT